MPLNGKSYGDPQIDEFFKEDPYQGRSLPAGTQYRGVPGVKTGAGGGKTPGKNPKGTAGKAPTKYDDRYND